jgi:glycosyltransferase involved in cell wall biosynthesis
VTTIHGFSSPRIVPVYQKYNHKVFYVSISDADRSPELAYIRTIYHGIDLAQFDFQPVPDNYLLFFGRMHHDKGVRQAIEIATACHKKLILAGIIQDQEYYDHFVAPYLNNQQVIYVGSVGPAERNRLLGQACALLHPIQFNEPFGLAVIEAMACGTPVIAFNRGSMPELIENGHNGFLVETVEEAIACVARLHEINREDCRLHVTRHFTVDRMVDNYLQVYAAMLDKGSGSLAKRLNLNLQEQQS